MKNLQENREEKWTFSSFAQMEGVVRRVHQPEEVILLLHGLGERGKRIFRRLIANLPKNALVIAPNGPFPIPRMKENKTDYGHSWYFYDKIEKKYFINQDLAKFWLRDLLKIENPKALPLTIIGFSQGGYLAPLVGKEIPETKLVIGLACEFRTTLIHEKLEFPMVAIHGDRDVIIPSAMALSEIEGLKKIGISVDFHSVNDTGHEISPEMAKTVEKVVKTYAKNSL